MRTHIANAPPGKIVLALDGRAFARELMPRVGRNLRGLFGSAPPTVHTVFVLTPDATPLPSSWFEDVASRLIAEAKDRIAAVQHAENMPFAAPDVLVDYRGSTQGVVEKVTAYAERCGAFLVVVPTAQKSALHRLLVGSFAESMLLHAAVPILTIGPACRQPGEALASCLVAIDLRAPLRPVFMDRVAELAALLDLELVFVHVELPCFKRSPLGSDPVLINPAALLYSDLTAEQNHALELLGKTVDHAAARGCRASGRLLISSLPTAKAIVYAATAEQARLVALASQSTPHSWLTTRSVAADVIRMASVPVWTLPYKAATSTLQK